MVDQVTSIFSKSTLISFDSFIRSVKLYKQNNKKTNKKGTLNLILHYQINYIVESKIHQSKTNI